MNIRERISTFIAKKRPAWIWQASAALLLLTSLCNAASSWTTLTNPMPAGNGVQLMMQLTDGSILVQGYNGFTWMKLTPDTTGSYINGAWTNLAPGPVPRLYFASQILQDGRLWILGGEYTGPGLQPNWSNTGEIYDPVTDSWHSVAPYPNQATGCPSLSSMTATLTMGSS